MDGDEDNAVWAWVCSADGKDCGCETADHTVAVSEERAANRTDSGRYLAAGAVRSLWVRTRQGQLADAMPRVRKEIAAGGNVIVESNSVLRFLRPDVFISVLDAGVADFKASAKRYLDRADAVVVTGGELDEAAWEGVSIKLVAGARRFSGAEGYYCSGELVEFVRQRLRALAIPAAGLDDGRREMRGELR